MKLKHKKNTNYSFEVKNQNGIFSKSRADIIFPLNLFEIINRLKIEKKKSIILNDCEIALELFSTTSNNILLKGNKFKIDIINDECFIGFSTDAVPLNLCLKLNDISKNKDIPVSRALINSMNFISK